MPPRAQKKPAAAKKPSPKPVSKPDPAPAAPAPAPAVEEVPAAQLMVEETVVTTTEVVEEKVVVEEVTAEEAAPVVEAEPEEEEVDPEEEVEPMDEEEEAEDGDGADLDQDVKEVEQKAGSTVVGAGDNQPSGGDNNQSGSGDENNGDAEEEEDLSMLCQPHLTDKKENKEIEKIFVGKLDKEAVEDDLVKVFGVFGELQSVRIVKHRDTLKSKGFGFVRYVNMEHAKKALAELKDGVQINGKDIKISAGHDNDTLYLGNIHKLWSKDKVMNTLKELGVDQIKDIVLPDDLKKEGKTKGFALIEFGSHAAAVAAFQRLRKPDAVFGCERSAKVAFSTSTSVHHSEEIMPKVESVYVEGLPESWDVGRVKEALNQYGETENVRLLNSGRKDFWLVDFTSHEGAVACVGGLRNDLLGEGDINVKARLTKPKIKRQTPQPPQGGFLVKMDADVAEELIQTEKKDRSNRRKTRAEGAKGSPVSKHESKPQPSKSTTPGKRRDRRGVDSVTNERPSKKPRNANYGSRHVRPANSSFGNQRAIYMARPTPYVPSYALPAPIYQAHAYARPSGSNHRHSDLEPHGGYLPAGLRYGSGYTRGAVQPPYQGYSGYPVYEDPYGYPPRRGYY